MSEKSRQAARPVRSGRPVSRNSRRRRRRRQRVTPALVVACIAAVAVLAAVIILAVHLNSNDGTKPADSAATVHTAEPQTTEEPEPNVTATSDIATEGDMTDAAMTAETPDTESSSNASVTEQHDVLQTAADNGNLPAPVANGFIPVVRQAQTDRKMIAITVDDCNQMSNTRQIIDCALENGGKITLFPIGINVLRSGFKDILMYAYENGMQIENHTHEHLGHYGLTDEELARQYYLQKCAVDYVLGVDYQQNFVRPMGGNGRDDQRLHLYCRLMGVKAIAHWSYSGGKGLSDLGKSLEPGQVYLFHTTDKDLEKLRRFIPYAVQQGYELVTLNELFGLPENEVRPLNGAVQDREIPLLGEYTLAPRTYQNGDFAWVAYLAQKKLIELGMLTGEPDGIYGSGTEAAVAAFQELKGQPVTGMLDTDTQRLLFENDADIMRMLFGN